MTELKEKIQAIQTAIIDKIDPLQKQVDALEQSQNIQTKDSKKLELERLRKDLDPFFQGKTSDLKIETKSTLFTGTNSNLSDVQNLTGVKATPKTSNRIIDAIPIMTMTGGVARYVQQSSYSDQAQFVAEASGSTESTSTLTEVSVLPKKVMTYMDFTMEFEKDVTGGLQFVTDSLRDTVLQKFDSYIWDGTTAANGFDGLSVCAVDASGSVDASTSETFQTWASGDADPNRWDVALAVSTYLKNRYYNPDLIIISPTDHFKMVNHKASDGQYVKSYERFQEYGNMKLVVSPTVDDGEYLIADSRFLAVFIRDQSTFEISRSNASNFVSDISTAKLSLRGALACFQPSALIHGTFAGSITALKA